MWPVIQWRDGNRRDTRKLMNHYLYKASLHPLKTKTTKQWKRASHWGILRWHTDINRRLLRRVLPHANNTETRTNFSVSSAKITTNCSSTKQKIMFQQIVGHYSCRKDCITSFSLTLYLSTCHNDKNSGRKEIKAQKNRSVKCKRTRPDVNFRHSVFVCAQLRCKQMIERKVWLHKITAFHCKTDQLLALWTKKARQCKQCKQSPDLHIQITKITWIPQKIFRFKDVYQ
jgi:hypothetical protein